MQISFLLVQLSAFFIPGIIWNFISIKFAQKTKPSDSTFIIQSFILGSITYLFEFFIFFTLFKFHFLTEGFELPSFSDESGNKSLASEIDLRIFIEIIIAIPLAFILSIFDLYISNYKLLARFLQFIGATKKYGDEDVWDFVFNSNTPGMEWVNIRDFENKVIFTGSVNVFSENEKTRELLMIAVIVYDFDGNELYRSPQMYISLPTDSTIIEFPSVEAIYSDTHPTESQDEPHDETDSDNDGRLRQDRACDRRLRGEGRDQSGTSDNSSPSRS